MDRFIEWDRILWNDLPYAFLLEVVFRSAVMFVLLLITLKIAGKRGVKQLSVFEVVIIISLGSAAGDPMFYEDVGIVPALTVFVTIIVMYRLVTWLSAKSPWFESLVEGKTKCLIQDGRFALSEFKKEGLAQDEFFSQLRLKGIEHLGQIKAAYMESNGEISIFFFNDSEVRYGLPLLPERFNARSKMIVMKGIHACTFCGNLVDLEPGAGDKEREFVEPSPIRLECAVCNHDEWVGAINTLRVS